jgi:LysR family transcriptional regulator, benzoate and cis,cis-muconate-responsive activator of ben and cat genes
MELRHLRYFSVVAETKSFTKAAAVLHVAQPAISKQISDLEEELGFSVFKRTTKEVELTEVGSFFLARVSSLQRELQKSIQEAQFLSQNVKNTCRVGFLSTPSFFFLPKIVEAYHQKFPDNRLLLKEGNPIDQLRWLLADDIDVAISRSFPDQSKFESLLIYKEPIVLAVAPDANIEAMRNGTASPQDVVIIAKEAAPGLHAITLNYVKESGIRIANIIEITDIHSALMMVEARLGIAFVPACVSKIKHFSVKFVRWDDKAPTIELFAMWKNERKRVATEFIDILRSHHADLDAGFP